ncbi:MAG TPA: PAS domain S-box protein [Methanospirillum sp.]|nr:PAS domain S-box protein [Methanospirillum sp.]
MIRVLYVDDEDILLEIGKRFLERLGDLCVETESSVDRALPRLASESFDAVVSDYQMPEKNGIDFLKAIRKSENSIPFIMFTGRGREEIVIEALKEGADFYLQKGGDPAAQYSELKNQLQQVVRRRRAEGDLRDNEAKYRTLFETAQDAIFLMDGERIIDCNRRTEELFGRHKEELINISFQKLSPEYQPDGVKSWESGRVKIQQAYEGTPQFFEWTHSSATGKEFIGEVSLSRVEISGTFFLLTIIRDISERRKTEAELHQKSEELASSYEELLGAEEELKSQYIQLARNEEVLRENQNQLNAIIQGSPIPQFVIDKDHIITHWNKALERYSGIRAEDVVGTTSQWKAFYQTERPCLADLLVDKNHKAIEEWYVDKYSPSHLISDAFEAVDFFPHMGEAGIWLYFTASLIRDSSGEIIGAVETLEDITSTKQSQEALMESEERYRSIIENIQDVVYRSDERGNLIMVSPSVLPLLGYKTLEECLGLNIAQDLYYNPADRNEFLQEMMKTGSVKNFDVLLKHQDGRPVQVSTSSHFYYQPDGTMAGVEGVFRDISEQKYAEEQLRENQAILNAVIQDSPIPEFVIDQNHQVTHWNRALEEFSGIAASEVIGTDRHWEAMYYTKQPCVADLLIDGDMKKIQEMYGEKIHRSELIEGGYEAVDFFPKGRETGAWLSFAAAPIHDKKGQIIGAVETLEDITTQVIAEQELKESEERFRTLFHNANDGIVLHRITDTGVPDRYIEVNESYCQMLGYSRAEMLQMSPKDVDAPETWENARKYVQILVTMGHARFEAIQRRKDQRTIQVEINAHIYTLNGEQVVLSIIRDISERKKYDQAVRDTNHKLHLLSSITRHDILNQLTALKAYLALSIEQISDADTLDLMYKADRSAETINRQISFTRDYQDIGIHNPDWQPVTEIIHAILNLVDPGDIKIEIQTADVEIFADPLLEKVFYNLVENAIRYGKTLSTISFSVQTIEQGIILICEDDGQGVPEHEKENIFTRNYYTNTGFGLFLAREILSITGLSITETGVEGTGARFEILCPEGTYRKGSP